MDKNLNRRRALLGAASAGALVGNIDRARAARAHGPATSIELGSGDFRPVFSINYGPVGVAGVQVVSGVSSFWATIHLPIGARIKSVAFYLNPNGLSHRVAFARYNALDFVEDIGPVANSSSGVAVEEIVISVNRNVEKGWNHRLGVANMSAGGALLYGGRVDYRLPREVEDEL